MQISWNVFSDLLSPSRTTTTIDFSNSRVLLHYEDLCQTICGQRRRVDWFPSMQVELVLGQIMPDHERMQCTCSQPTITVECVIWEGLPKKPKEWSFWNLHSLKFIDPVWFLVYLIHTTGGHLTSGAVTGLHLSPSSVFLYVCALREISHTWISIII